MGLWQWTDNFEPPDPDWFLTGGAGFDMGKGYAHTGPGNAWVRQSSGWNAINRFQQIPEHEFNVTFSAWLRLSPTLTDGYFSVRAADPQNLNGNGEILHEIKLVGPGPDNADNANYNQYSFEVDTGDLTMVLAYVGLWGVGRGR